MINITEETMDRMQQLKIKSDTLINSLDGEYPLTAGETYGVLGADHSYLLQFDETCDSLYYESRQLEKELNEIMDSCSDLVDFGNIKYELRNTTSKLENIRFFKEQTDLYMREVKELDEYMAERFGSLYNIDDVRRLDTVNVQYKLELLMADLESKNITLEQYRSAVLDTFMYLDIYNDEKLLKYEYKGENLVGKTLEEVLLDLKKYEIYDYNNSIIKKNKDITRWVDYKIVEDAIKLDPELGKFKIVYSSREEKEKNGNLKYNEGTNNIVFQAQDGSYYFAIRGTSKGEWIEDGNRFNVKNTEIITHQLEELLSSYEEFIDRFHIADNDYLIVTGHSQGGNDSQSITLYSKEGNLVDKCFSFDGEGHSPDVIEYLKKNYTEEDYTERISKMYSICGEYDFVNRLGDRVFLDDPEHTIFVHCDIEGGARMHDIVSMFCVKEGDEYNYSGVINTAKGTSPTIITAITAGVWKQIRNLPFETRVSCQTALTGLIEKMLNGIDEGINGEKSTDLDTYLFSKYGIDLIFDAIEDAIIEENVINPAKKAVVEHLCGGALAKGYLNEKQSEAVSDMFINALDSIERRRIAKDKFFDTLFNTALYLAESEQDKERGITDSAIQSYVYIQSEHFLDYMLGELNRQGTYLKDYRLFFEGSCEASFNLIREIGEYMSEHADIWFKPMPAEIR